MNVGFILVPGFALMSYAAATEPLRAANLLAGREIYRVAAFSPEGGPALSSSGIAVPAAALPSHGSGLDMVFVCAGGSPRDWHHPAIFACLRQLARDGVRIGGISGGPYLLAAAGLLAGRDFTIHWEHAPALLEAFPDLAPRQARFVIDGNRITCGGGVAPLDMMHVLIAERMGPDFARRVSDWYLHTQLGDPAAPQRASLAERYGVHHPGLLAVLERMEETIETPLDRAAMARIAGVTPRHLDRLFAGHLGVGFLDQYRRIRLQHAHRLLTQSPLLVSEIAVATGFSSAGHFSRLFRDAYGCSPRDLRRA
jgi:transcriptional regulator GlxA family with amidase domain